MSSVVFIDSSIAYYDSLAAALAPGTEIVVLNTDTPGFGQIAGYLDGRAGIDAIHLVSEGSAGRLYLGNSIVDTASLERHADSFYGIGRARSANGDLLLYGCTSHTARPAHRS